MTARASKWVILIAALTVFVSTILLGRWQLQRAWLKEALAEQARSCLQMPALSNEDVVGGLLSAVCDQRKVALAGHWLVDKTVYLDNRQMNGRPGFFVLTPLKLEGSQTSILVQRGWVARNFMNREQVPALDTPSGRVWIEGRLVPPPSKLYQFGSAEVGVIRQNLDISSFAAETGLSLLPKSVQQTGTNSEGLLRDWQVVASGADKHYGYAFQWFGLSCLTLILYVWFQIVGFRFKKQ